MLALLVAGVLFSIAARTQNNRLVEQMLRAEARLAADLVATLPAQRDEPNVVATLDREADRLGNDIAARVTFIAEDGAVLGDSAEPLAALASMENHASRPEVLEARAHGIGTAQRASATLGEPMLYVAVRVQHPLVTTVRVALPLTTIRQQLARVLTTTLLALGLALLGSVLAAGFIARRLGYRVRAIASIAERYRRGDLTASSFDYGDDELGTVARALDDSVHELGNRLQDIERDRGRIATILSGMIEGVIVIDQPGRVQLMNNAAREMMKIDEPAVGRHYVEVIRHPTVSTLVTMVLGGDAGPAVEFVPPRDATRTIIGRAARVGDGATRSVVIVLHDITELRKSDKIRRDFVANVSHELRTPLTAIRGYLEAISDSDDLSDDERRQFLDIIKRHAKRMERLVQDLLRLARLDAGQEQLAQTSCELQDIIQDVAEELHPSLAARHQTVEVDVSDNAQLVMADESKLHDVLHNLIANGSAYAPEGTTIRIEAQRVDGRIAINVLDQGPGVPESEQRRVFERFYRVDKSRARDPGGTGLGLAIVKHLIELHGGRVFVTNRPTGGAKFTVELRAADEGTHAAASRD